MHGSEVDFAADKIIFIHTIFAQGNHSWNGSESTCFF